jgi:hypothetical protein
MPGVPGIIDRVDVMPNGGKGLTAEIVSQKLKEFDGNLAAVGRACGVSRQAVWNFIQRRPKLLAVATDTREATKDDVESALTTQAKAGEAWAVQFYLRTQARDRGYVDKSEHEHRMLGSVDVRVSYEDGFHTSPASQDSPAKADGAPTANPP